MSVGKEALFVLTELAKSQTQIYADAADTGFYETPENRTAIRNALNELRQLEGGVATTGENCSTYETRLGFEVDGGTINGG